MNGWWIAVTSGVFALVGSFGGQVLLRVFRSRDEMITARREWASALLERFTLHNRTSMQASVSTSWRSMDVPASLRIVDPSAIYVAQYIDMMALTAERRREEAMEAGSPFTEANAMALEHYVMSRHAETALEFWGKGSWRRRGNWFEREYFTTLFPGDKFRRERARGSKAARVHARAVGRRFWKPGSE